MTLQQIRDQFDEIRKMCNDAPYREDIHNMAVDGISMLDQLAGEIAVLTNRMTSTLYKMEDDIREAVNG